MVPKGAAQVARGGACFVGFGAEGAVAAHGAEAHPAAQATLPPRQGGPFVALTEWRLLTEERVRAPNIKELFLSLRPVVQHRVVHQLVIVGWVDK